ncbi:hypothetical protein Cflav_PD5917 [Pedosphaera parvula Ellin514]|uniref:Uncharacterized protein n=1 Tax=Pedosphaera parvula (strain Ellin514) TaxID=320771 RepID=B9X9N8_PEDPL|nr:hypothetical protein Cflav_PD5917 [Pedosphaera parvula Ellin514]
MGECQDKGKWGQTFNCFGDLRYLSILFCNFTDDSGRILELNLSR